MSDLQPSGSFSRRNKKLKNDEAFGPWIVSYADTVTLLLCFFVIFYAEQKKPSEASALIEITKDLLQGRGDEKVSKSVKPEYKDIEFVNKKDEILIRLYEENFFKVGAFKLKEKGRKVIQDIAQTLKPYQDKIFIQFEGHTDTLKVSKRAYYRGNLGLSSLRAAEAAQIFIDSGMDEAKIKVSGYGSSRPLFNDRSPASQGAKYLPQAAKKNRRVELRISTDDSLNLEKIFKLNK